MIAKSACCPRTIFTGTPYPQNYDLFDLLFAAAKDTPQALVADKKHLGAQLGITAILHTWTRQLTFHPHLHCVVTGGGLTPDGKCWRGTSKSFWLH